jgi:hypothetical protein
LRHTISLKISYPEVVGAAKAHIESYIRRRTVYQQVMAKYEFYGIKYHINTNLNEKNVARLGKYIVEEFQTQYVNTRYRPIPIYALVPTVLVDL